MYLAKNTYLCKASLCYTKAALQDAKGGGDGFEVQKYGDGRVALIGQPLQVLPAKFHLLWHLQDRVASAR